MTSKAVRQPDERARALTALDLRIEGKTWSQIADALGYADESGARKATSRLLSRIEHEKVVELRELESLKLDAMQRAAWSEAVSGELDAIKVVLQIHDRKVRLFGLAAPVAVRVGPEPPTDVEFFEQAVELITAITSAPGGREELLRGLGHPGHAVLDAERQMAVAEGNRPGRPLPHGSGPSGPDSCSAEEGVEPWSNL